MTRITVEFVGVIRRPWQESSRALDLPDGTTLADLLGALGFAAHEITHVVVWVDSERRRLTHTLQGGETVTVGLLTGGG